MCREPSLTVGLLTPAHVSGACFILIMLRRLLFLRENSLPTPPFYSHLVFRGVELNDYRTLDLKFILCRRFERSSGFPGG